MNLKRIMATAFTCVMAVAANALPYSAEMLEAMGVDYEYSAVNSIDEVCGDELLQGGNFDSWSTRTFTESKLLGGKTVNLAKPASPWCCSNVHAKLAGIVKTNESVYKDSHSGNGSCAKLYSHLVSCKVLGMVDIEVFAAGSIFLGSIAEPITGASNPYGKINFGIPFTKKPKAIKFDYKTQIVGGSRIKKGVGSKSTVGGQDMAEMVCILQKRTEDASGNITAVRVGTVVKRFNKTSGWVNGASFPIIYGDASKQSGYNAESMGLAGKGGVTRNAKNKKGRIVPIKETGWDGNATPTHLIVQFSSSHGGAYIGTVGNTMWVDNVKMVY